MKMRFYLFMIFSLLLVSNGQASVAVTPKAAASNAVEAGVAHKETLKKQMRMEKRKERFEKRVAKIKNKLEKKMPAPSVWDDSRFRIGVILVAGAIVLGIIAGLVSSGFLGILASLVAIAGLVFVIWSLIDYYG